MKDIHSHLVSVIKGTNRVIGSSESSWSKIPAGSYFRVDKDDIFYTVAKTAQIFYIKEFEVVNEKRLKVSKDVAANLIAGDVLTLTYKEQELHMLLEIRSAGLDYKIGDIIYINGGKPSFNLNNNLPETTQFTIEEIDQAGGIKQLGLLNRGKYLESPQSPSELIGGAGTQGMVDFTFREYPTRATVNKTVTNIVFEKDYSLVDLDYPLPVGVKAGKLSVEKWEMTLKENYAGETRLNVNYQVARNFTPFIDLPVMSKGQFNNEMIFNAAMKILDQEIQKLKEKSLAFQKFIDEQPKSL